MKNPTWCVDVAMKALRVLAAKITGVRAGVNMEVLEKIGIMIIDNDF